MKTRVWKLAKDLGISTKELLEIAKKQNLNINSPLCALETDQESQLRSFWELSKKSGLQVPESCKTMNAEPENMSEQTQDAVVESPKKEEDAAVVDEQTVLPASEITEQVPVSAAEKVTSPSMVPTLPELLQPEMKKHVGSESQTEDVVMPVKSVPAVAEQLKQTKDQIHPSPTLEVRAKQPFPVSETVDKKRTIDSEQKPTVVAQPQKSNNAPVLSDSVRKQPMQAGSTSHPGSPASSSTHVGTPRESAKSATGLAAAAEKKPQNLAAPIMKGKAPLNVVSGTERASLAKAPGIFPTPQKPDKLSPTPVTKTSAVRKIAVVVPISVKEFSRISGIGVNLIIQKTFESSKQRLTLNDPLDETMVEWLGLEFKKHIVIKPKPDSIETTVLKELEQQDSPEDLQQRAPIVTFMGHVDHGKTSLLDRIRQTNIAAHEAGGITQHIGAYKINTNNYSIVFLDTPGHEAFTSMRSRGAHVTDIVVLVVAADEGVMPQTIEAINHAKAANVSIVVALNKIDKPGAKPEMVMQQLSKYGLIPEKWQGDTGFIEVSALTGQGIPALLEYLGLVAEMRELKANPKRKAYGVVLEARVMEGKGAVASLLIQNGSLRRGDNILCGIAYGRVRDMTDDAGNIIQEAGPSTPVEISGLNELPDAGDKFNVIEDVSIARNIAEDRKKLYHAQALAKGAHKPNLAELMKQLQKGEQQDLKIILKTDVHGSLEAIVPKLEGLSTDEIKVKLLHAAVGGINERDVQLADASQGIVVGFTVTANKMARDIAEEKGIEIRYYDIIYHLLEDVKNIMRGMLLPQQKEEITGHAVVRKILRITGVGHVAGSYVTDGIIERSSLIRLSRNGIVINKDKPLTLSSLKHFKEDVNKIKSGFECGIKLEGYEDIKEGDEVEAFKIVMVARNLEDSKSQSAKAKSASGEDKRQDNRVSGVGSIKTS